MIRLHLNKYLRYSNSISFCRKLMSRKVERVLQAAVVSSPGWNCYEGKFGWEVHQPSNAQIYKHDRGFG